MRDDMGGEEVEENTLSVSRKELFDDYVNYYTQVGSAGQEGPCCQNPPGITTRARLFLSLDPGERFETFPLYQLVCEGLEAGDKDHRSFMQRIIRATELLEMYCINLFLYPWRKEFKTIKTFTGPFVYCLQPVLPSPTIQSVLGSIGYLPQTKPHHRSVSQYCLSEEATPDRAISVGFELLLARVESQHLLELTGHAQPESQQEWAEIIQKRVGHHHGNVSSGHPPSREDSCEETVGKEREEEEEEREEEEEEGELSRGCSLVDPGEMEKRAEEKEEEDGMKESVKQDLQALSLSLQPVVKPQPRPRRGIKPSSTSSPLLSEDRSIMEMQKNYPDLAIRGCRLLQDKPHKASRRNGSKAANANTNGSKTSHVIKYGGSSSSDSSSGSVISRVGDLSISMHITLRAGWRKPWTSEDQTMRTGEPEQPPRGPAESEEQPSEGPPTLHMNLAEEEERELKELAERMGQLDVQDHKEKKKKRRKEERDKRRPY